MIIAWGLHWGSPFRETTILYIYMYAYIVYLHWGRTLPESVPMARKPLMNSMQAVRYFHSNLVLDDKFLSVWHGPQAWRLTCQLSLRHAMYKESFPASPQPPTYTHTRGSCEP